MADLADISLMSRKLLDVQEEIARKTDELKALKEHERQLAEESLPSAMQELGLSKVVLDTGETVTVSQEVYASIPVANREAAYSWLEENGYGGLIKTSVAVGFGKGEIDRAMEVMQQLSELGLEPTFEKGVHAQTLKAFIKEQLSTAQTFPLDLFGAQPVNVTKIKLPK